MIKQISLTGDEAMEKMQTCGGAYAQESNAGAQQHSNPNAREKKEEDLEKKMSREEAGSAGHLESFTSYSLYFKIILTKKKKNLSHVCKNFLASSGEMKA